MKPLLATSSIVPDIRRQCRDMVIRTLRPNEELAFDRFHTDYYIDIVCTLDEYIYLGTLLSLNYLEIKDFDELHT